MGRATEYVHVAADAQVQGELVAQLVIVLREQRVVERSPAGLVSVDTSADWTLHSQGNGYFTMVNVQSGLCRDDPYGKGHAIAEPSAASRLQYHAGAGWLHLKPRAELKFNLQSLSDVR